MPEISVNQFRDINLSGARIWLSGALPENGVISDKQRANLSAFVKMFARFVFESGGHIVHGSHPSFTPILLEEAKRHQKNGGRKDVLMLAVSRFWSKDPDTVPLEEWRKNAIVYETPEVLGTNSPRDDSLLQLRKWTVARCDAVVVAGGLWWQAVAGRAGIPVELDLATQNGLPCFLLGGFGGAAKVYVDENPEILSKLKNGLDKKANYDLAILEDVEQAAAIISEQLERLPLIRGQSNEGISFRILALDGGGVKGAFTAAALAAWEKQTGLRIVDHFDMIAGTSTGGILAIGLGLGLSGQEMLDFYRTKGDVIFPMTRFFKRLKHNIQRFFKPKFSQQILLQELESAYYQNGSPKLIKDSQCRLVIPSYHAATGCSHVFRTPHHPNLSADAKIEAAHVALATSAAPTFFTAAKIANLVAESNYFDGGVWANSPTMAAVIEANRFLGIPMERIDILSVGTTEEPFSARSRLFSGLAGWLYKGDILNLLMNVQQESALKLTKDLVGTPRFLRVNQMTGAGTYALDSTKEIDELADLGAHVAMKADTLAQVKARFLNGVKVSPWGV